MDNRTKKNLIKGVNVTAFLLPALLLFVGVLIAPIIMSTYYSFFDWNGMSSAKEFIGFSNYIELFTSDDIMFGKSVWHALLLAILSVGIQLPIALGLALMLGRGIKGERFFLSVFFMPVLISTVVIGQLWIKIYNPDYGILNMFLNKISGWIYGFNDNGTLVRTLGRPWLGDPKVILEACFVPMIWQYVGYHMLLMYAGIKGVPIDLREAAMLDGATDGQVNRFIVIPYVKPILKVSVIFAVTGSLKSYDLFKVLTRTVPVDTNAHVPSIVMIDEMFTRSRYGMGSAVAVIMIILCFAFALIISAIFREED